MTEYPQVLVVVPTRNRFNQLAKCVQSLALQNYPKGFWKVIIVNDGGDDPTSSIPDLAKFPVPITILSTPHRGPSAARNTGAASESPDLIAFLDDDCRPDCSWLNNLSTGIWNSPYHACTGQTLNLFPLKVTARATQFFYEFYRDYQRFPNGDLYLVMSNNAIYRYDVFRTLGGFAEGFILPGAEDLDLSHRLCARGYRQGFIPDAMLNHAHASTAHRYLRQQFQYGRGYTRMHTHLRKLGIPIQIGQRRRPQFHIALWQVQRRDRLAWRENLLIWVGICAHTMGSLFERFSQYKHSSPLKGSKIRIGSQLPDDAERSNNHG
jgi:GT2 family glycosyltransferase